MALSIHEAYEIVAGLRIPRRDKPQSVRTTRAVPTLRYSHPLVLNDFGWKADVDVDYWFDDDNRIEVEVLSVTLVSADENTRRQLPLSMFSEDALREMRDEVAGELEAANDAEWGA